jgi:exodeoxyribonuclease VII large subunit
MNKKLSLTELQLIIRDSLYVALPDMYWVIAEIAEIKTNYAGHCFIELVEKHPDDINIRARVKAIIWANRYRFLRPLFESVTGESLKEGFKVLVKVTVEYHEIYGLSLIINDIDPAFTIGEMVIKRQEIIRMLEQDGVISMNKELEFPILPKRIAIITSKNAAGYADFINQLTGNSFGFTFSTALFEAVMQGTETENGIINALDRISENIDLFDVAVIIRGGGSQTDLSWFDNYNIAYHITQFPIPVITGIGHEKDMSVTDMVANRQLKTPTAVADFLVGCMIEAENHINDLSTKLSELSMSVIDINWELLETCKMKLIPVARMMISDVKGKLSVKIIDIINIGKEYIVREEVIPAGQRSRLFCAVKFFCGIKEAIFIKTISDLKNLTFMVLSKNDDKVEVLKNNLNIMSPENVLKRGYTITFLNEMILKNTDNVKTDDIIITQFSKGILKSKVTDKK